MPGLQLQELQSQLFLCIIAYEVYIGIWPTEQIVDVLNRHRGFFIPVRNSLWQAIMMGLAKVFDRDKRTMSLRNLLRTAEQQMDKLVPHLAIKDIQDMNARLSRHEEQTDAPILLLAADDAGACVR